MRIDRPGHYYENRHSYIGYGVSGDGVNFKRFNEPLISPSESYDVGGCEDPRITLIEDTYWITYTAIEGTLDDLNKRPKIRIALASTKDFKEINKLGVIGPNNESKAAAIFPEKINGEFQMLFTNNSDSAASKISLINFESFDDLINCKIDWAEDVKTVLDSNELYHRGPEVGAVPVNTKVGWLLVFSTESFCNIWTTSIALLDKENLSKIISRTSGYVLQPATDYEMNGIVPNVTFPEGAVIIDDKLYVYYGAADTVIGLATIDINKLLSYLSS